MLTNILQGTRKKCTKITDFIIKQKQVEGEREREREKIEKRYNFLVMER